MPSANKDILISELERQATFASYFHSLKCANLEGHFSLIFRAKHHEDNSEVAVKVLDPDYLTDPYRHACFERESVLLADLRGKERCLQLVESLSRFALVIPVGGKPFQIEVPFFITEWLEGDIESHFQNPLASSVLDRLDIYRGVLLAVAALQRAQISHRDLKSNNFRQRPPPNATIVVIDLGTAATAASSNVISDYPAQVGHRGYSPPESFCGLAGARELGFHTDAYSLGVMLHELFSSDKFLTSLLAQATWQSTLRVMYDKLLAESSTNARLKMWRRLAKEVRQVPTPPALDDTGTLLPLAIRDQIERLYRELIAFDFDVRRTDLAGAIRIIDGCRTALRNQHIYERQLSRKREQRRLAQERARRLDVRRSDRL
jgi:serine/threonine protein kinase